MHLATAFENCVGFFGYSLVELLAVFVVLVYLDAFAGGFLGIAGNEQFHGFAAALHASGGVYPRSYFEYDVAYAYLLAAESAGSYYGSQSEIWVGVKAFQPHVRHSSVLVDHRNNVGGYAHGHEVEHALKFGCGYAVAYRERLHQLVAHAAA